MRNLDLLWLLLAGFGGGLTGSIAGLASLVSYPALLAVGIPALTANMTNTVALVFSGVGSVWGSRPELAAHPARLRSLGGAAVAGGIVGAALLFLTPAHFFALLVPWLIGLGSLGVLARRRAPVGAATRRERPVLLATAVFFVSLYGGYFGAASGVVLLAVLLAMTTVDFARSVALKNLLLGLANAVAAAAFVFEGPVRWSAAVPLAAGFLVGGRLGPGIVRRVPAGPLRVFIACGGVALAVHLGLGAYS